MDECAAVIEYLCDRHPASRMAPTVDDSAGALYLQTLVYFFNSVHNAYQLTCYLGRFTDKAEDQPECTTLCHSASAAKPGLMHDPQLEAKVFAH